MTAVTIMGPTRWRRFGGCLHAPPNLVATGAKDGTCAWLEGGLYSLGRHDRAIIPGKPGGEETSVCKQVLSLPVADSAGERDVRS